MTETEKLYNPEDNERKPFSYGELTSIVAEAEDKISDYYSKRPEGVNVVELEQKLTVELLERLLAEKDKFKQVFNTENGSTYFVLDTGESFRIKKQKPDEWHKEYDIQPVTKSIFFIEPEEWKKLDDIRKNNRQFYTRVIGEPVMPEELEAFAKRRKIYEELIGHKVEDREFQMVDSGRESTDRLIGEPIPVTELKEGVIPLEIDMVEGGSETIYKIEGNNLLLMGHKTKGQEGEKDNIWPEGVGITHYGHPVKDVIKS